MKKISIVIPMYCEQDVVNICYNRIINVFDSMKEKYDYEMIFVNDGSIDDTKELLHLLAAKDNKVKVISFSRNFGHQQAVTAGIREANSDAVIIIDADMQDPPECILDMLKLWEDGNDVVYAVRKKREGETKFKLFTAKMFYKVLNKLSDVKIPKDTGDFRLIDKKVVDVINSMPEHSKFLRGLVSWIGFKQVPYEYERKERVAGKTKYPLKKMLKLASDGIFGFSTKPLKIIGILGIISLGVSFLIFIYAIISYIFKLNYLIPGWTSIMVTITFLSGMQFLSIWVMSEYIARIYEETKKRPEYIVEEKRNFDE